MDIEIDKSQLFDLAGDDHSFLIPIVEDFRENAAEIIDGIEGALATNDSVKIKGLVHQLKGSSGSLGMKSLQHYCITLEQLPENGFCEKHIQELRACSDGSVHSVLAYLSA